MGGNLKSGKKGQTLLVVLLVGRVLLAWDVFGSRACLDRIHRARQSLGSGTANKPSAWCRDIDDIPSIRSSACIASCSLHLLHRHMVDYALLPLRSIDQDRQLRE